MLEKVPEIVNLSGFVERSGIYYFMVKNIDVHLQEKRRYYDNGISGKKLNGDEKVRLQLQAREDYERRLIGEYNRGTKDGMSRGIEQGLKKGIMQGLEQGLEQGEQISLINLIIKKCAKGKTLKQTADELEVSVNEIKRYYGLVLENKDASAEDILKISKN